MAQAYDPIGYNPFDQMIEGVKKREFNARMSTNGEFV